MLLLTALALLCSALTPVGSAAAPSATPTERVLAHTETLLSFGPREHRSPGEQRALSWISGRLEAAGYTPTLQGDPGVLWACTAGEVQPGAIWFLAHPDSVSSSVPGAVDNAVGVAALVVLAEDLATLPPPSQVCVAFPRAEELGLVGSIQWVATTPPPEPGLVVALDLVGQGQLSATGLGPRFGDDAIAWLAGFDRVEQPVAYRIVSRKLGIERSDHGAFRHTQVPAMHLLGRGRSGIYWAYHSPADGLEQVEPQAVEDLMETLSHMSRTRPLPQPGAEAAVKLPHLGFVLPGGLVWLLWGGGLIASAGGWRGWRSAGVALGVSAAGTAMGAGLWAIGALGRVQHAALATPLTLVWLLTLAAATWAAPHSRRAGEGASLAFGILALPAGLFDPILGVWLSLGALGLALTRYRPIGGVLGLGVPVFLCLPSTWRELVFHHLLPPQGLVYMPVRALVCWPVVALGLSIPRWRRGPVLMLASALVMLVVSLLMPAWSAAFPPLETP